MGGVRNIMVRGVADFSQLSTAMQRAQGEATTFGTHFESIFTRIGLVGNGLKFVFEGIMHGVENLKEFAQEAGELDGRLSSLNARLGSSAQAFQQWANQNEQVLGISKKDMIEQGASISAMLQTSIHDKQQLTKETENMLKNIAIVSSATGKSQQEVSERMVSALQGHSAAVSALDLNMHLSSLRMTEAYKRIAGSSPWAKLTAEQQQMIIVSALNEQVATRFGTQVADDVATRMNRFTAALSDVKTNLEQAFQPILYQVLPILSTFINYINVALQYVTAFFQTLFGYHGYISKVTSDLSDQTDAVNGLAGAYNNLNKATGTKAKSTSTGGVSVPKVGSGSHALKNGSGTVGGGKKLGTGFIASFDQVHTITEKNNSSGSGSGGSGSSPAVGGGGVPVGSTPLVNPAPTNSALQNIQSKVKDFVDKFKAFLAPVEGFFKQIWGVVSTYFKGVIDGMVKWWNQWGGQIVQALKNVWAMAQPIIMWLAKFIWDSIKGVIDGVIKFFEGLIEFLTGIFTGNWKAAFKGLVDMTVGAIQAIWNFFNLTLFGGVKKLLIDLVADGAKIMADLVKAFEKPLSEFLAWIGKGIADAVRTVISYWQNFGTWLSQEGLAWGDVFKYLWKGVTDGASKVWSGIKNIFGGAYKWFMQSLVSPITQAFNNISNGFSTGGVVGGLKAVWNQIADNINTGIGFINGVLGTLHAPTISFQAPHMFAKGGIVTGATNAIVGEAGTEVIQPLSALKGMMASTIAQTIQTIMSMQGGSKNSSSQPIVLNVDGKTLARIMKPLLDAETKRVGTNVRLNTV